MSIHDKEVPISYGSKVMAKFKVFNICTCRSKDTVKATRSTLLARLERHYHKNVHMKYESSTSNGSQDMAKVKVFRNVGQRSRSRSPVNRLRFHLKGFYQLSIHAKYEVLISHGSKVIAKHRYFLPQSQSNRDTDRGDKK